MKLHFTLLAGILLLAFTLRFTDLAHLPNGLHWDEQDTGYQAYSLLKTGRDYMGNKFPLFLHSFADYRTPVYIYSAVPSVAVLGLTPVGVRLPSIIYSLLSILLIYIVATRLFKSPTAGLIAALALALSPWHVQYSRQSVETISLFTMTLAGVACFFHSFTRPKWLVLSGLFFGLGIAAYSPGKVFLPLFLIALFFIYLPRVKKYGFKLVALSVLVFALISAPIVLDGIFGKSGMRFRELSIFTDPTLADTVGYRRLDQQLASGIVRVPGLSPRFIDKLVYNKPTLLFASFAKNYLESFSTTFLFTMGDRELRHSPGRDTYGMLQPIEAVALLIGLLVLLTTHNSQPKTILAWLLLAPISGSLTRWDNPHAARLLIMLPAWILIITSGFQYLYTKFKPAALMYILFLALNSVFTYSYFFSNYRTESAPGFQWGFDWAIRQAVTGSVSHDRVIVDFANDSPLMAYLFGTGFDPKQFQALMPLADAPVVPGQNSRQFGNIYLMQPGSYAWSELLSNDSQSTLLVISAKNPAAKRLGSPKETLSYPDSEPAFYIFEK